MRDLVQLMKALADENRLRIIAALEGRELCLCQIVELLGLATSTVSRHMAILYQARLVDARKAGRWTYFRPAAPGESPSAAEAATLVIRAVRKGPRARADRKRLKEILKVDPEQLCRAKSEWRSCPS